MILSSQRLLDILLCIDLKVLKIFINPPGKQHLLYNFSSAFKTDYYIHTTYISLTMQHFLLHLKLNTDCTVNTLPQCTCFKQEDVKSKNFGQNSILLIPEKQTVTYWKLACSYSSFEIGILPEMFSSMFRLVIYLQVT